jgi:transposase
MRFVEPKSAEQPSRAILFRARKRLVSQRTDVFNALRACLYEYGYTVPQGLHPTRRSPYRPAASANAAVQA